MTELERIAVLETKVAYLEKDREARTAREHWMIGVLIGIASIIIYLLGSHL